MNINTLIRFLDRQLKYCDGVFGEPKIAYDQAFGGVQLFCELYPNEEQKVVLLWEDYKQRFEKIVYKI